MEYATNTVRATFAIIENDSDPFVKTASVRDPKCVNIEIFDPEDSKKVLNNLTWTRHQTEETRKTQITTDVTLKLDEKPTNIEDVYARLYLLSTLRCLPNTINLEGIFSYLKNWNWTNKGPMEDEEVLDRQISDPFLHTYYKDKFPRLLNHLSPENVRIADGGVARLGAYIGSETTVMFSGAINFNSGTRGKAMVEGRISQAVLVGHNSDIGGGASVMGTLSGGNKKIISIGNNCLLGALAGIGISLGNNCVVEAGLYVMPRHRYAFFRNGAGSRHIMEVKTAEELSGQDNITFVRMDGANLGSFPTKKTVPLNDDLHKNT